MPTEEEYAKRAEHQRRFIARMSKDETWLKRRREILAAYKRRNLHKNRAHWAVHKAIQRGVLVRPKRCEYCGGTSERPIEASHDDYNKPLEVEWLCRPCHKKKDRRY